LFLLLATIPHIFAHFRVSAFMSVSGLKDLAKEHKLVQDHKREIDNKKKWALGERDPVSQGHPSRRPGKPNTPA